MTTFLTVKEAAQIVKKSPSSVRRIIHPIVKSDDHPDRHHIQPSVEDVPELRLKGESFAWRISEELLKRSTPADESTPAGAKAAAGHSDGPHLAMLERELAIKNGQIQQQAELIANQMKLIEGLGDRIREGNLLIGSLQQQLALPHPTGRHTTTEAHVVPDTKPAKEPNKRPPKKRKRWFGW